MKALLVTMEGVEEIDYEDSAYGMQDAIGCEYFCSAGTPAEDHMAFVDDTGLLTMTHDSQVNAVAWYPQPLIGKILVVRIGDEGESLPPTMTSEELAAMVRSLPAHQVLENPS